MNEFGLKPDVIDFITEVARNLNMEKVILFGSRAKGTFHEKSDIDLAVAGSSYHGFVGAIEEDCPTLLPFDFVDLGDDISDELRQRIEDEGVILYE